MQYYKGFNILCATLCPVLGIVKVFAIEMCFGAYTNWF